MVAAAAPRCMTALPVLRIAVTGTPGSGKTSICTSGRAHHSELGEPVAILTVEELARGAGALGVPDSEDGAAPIDTDLLREHLATDWNSPPDFATLVDGHLAHLLDVDAILIIRCQPALLSERNRARGWPDRKVEENSEWELLGGPWNDWEEWADAPVLELDSSRESPADSFNRLLEWSGNGFKPERPERSIDWIERLHG